MNSILSQARLGGIGLLALLAVSVAVAQEGAVSVALQGDAPTDAVIASFDGPEADGMGWYRDVADWKDVGISFRATSDGELRKVTLRIQAIRSDFQQEAKFRVEVYENPGVGENPLDGKKLYSGEGRLAVQKSDTGMFLEFDLGQAVPLLTGNSYTIVLIWEEPATVIVFQANPAYTEGFCWFRNETTDGKFKPANDSSRPGLTYFIQ
jgi:hypothetical protein